MNPVAAAPRAQVMWKPRSLIRSEFQDTKNETMAPRKYGGAVRRSEVFSSPYPRPWTSVGKKKLKP
jgi:hypothetical protein